MVCLRPPALRKRNHPLCSFRRPRYKPRLLAHAVFPPFRRRLADRREKSGDDLRAHFRRSEGQASRILQRRARPEDFLLIDDDETVVADSADGLRELAALRPERLEIRLLQFAARMRHQPAESRQSAHSNVLGY